MDGRITVGEAKHDQDQVHRGEVAVNGWNPWADETWTAKEKGKKFQSRQKEGDYQWQWSG